MDQERPGLTERKIEEIRKAVEAREPDPERQERAFREAIKEARKGQA
jgi:hypothetical protein